MKSAWMPLIILVGFSAATGCNKPGPDATAQAGTATNAAASGYLPTLPGEPTEAQRKLPTMKLYVGSQEMVAELALTPQQVQTGMMFRTNMDENAGMLFVLPYTQRTSFWMKNCPYPLSAAYINPEGIIEEIHPLEPFNTNSVIASTDNIRFVLETPRGWFDKHGIKPGVAIATERGPLMKTFLGGQAR